MHACNTHITTNTNPPHTDTYTFPFSLSSSIELKGALSVSRIWFNFQALLLQAWGPSSAVATSLERHAGWVPNLHFGLRKRVWSNFFFPFWLLNNTSARPRDHFSKQRYRWGWLFFLKSHTVLMNAICVTVNRPFSLSHQPCRAEAQTIGAGGIIGEYLSCPMILRLYWMLGILGAQAIQMYYQAPTLRDYNSVGWGWCLDICLLNKQLMWFWSRWVHRCSSEKHWNLLFHRWRKPDLHNPITDSYS